MHSIACLDGLLSFAHVAYQKNYVRPIINDTQSIIIKDGRHPVIESINQHAFIANDTVLADNSSTWIITGPNMGGKSTYLRQVALNSLMAHVGSFVAAKHAEVSLLDRIFTRIGSGDNLAAGKSTFLVEMEETATICSDATEKSLVILDEVGRGTSTFDGLAIAQSVVEYITKNIKARCLFATHYHELTLLEKNNDAIVCYHAASKQSSSGIIFLYKMLPGIANGSFGIDVAQLAQLPSEIVNRSRELIQEFQHKSAQSNLIDHKSNDNSNKNNDYHILQEKYNVIQLELQEQKEKVDSLMNIDFDSLSPKKAFDILWELKEK